MKVQDIMQTGVCCARVDETVIDAARRMAERRVSGLPVVDAAGKLVGILSEGDLIGRAELGGGEQRSRSWWLDLFGAREKAADYVKSHGKRVGDVMSKPVQTIAPDVDLSAAAMKLETQGVKRLPVMDGDRLVGIISRADIVRAFASLQPKAADAHADDAAIRKAARALIDETQALSGLQATVIVKQGVVELWGLAPSADVMQAARVAVEGIAGVRRVDAKLTLFPSAYYA